MRAQFPATEDTMADFNNPDAGVSQEDSGSITTFDSIEEVAKANQDLTNQAEEEQTQNLLDVDPQATDPEKPAETEEESDDSTAESEDEVSNLLKETENDPSTTIKKLRSFLSESQKQKYELQQELEKLQGTPQEANLDAEALLKGLRSFDLKTGEPTTKPFAENIYQADPNLAQRVFEDLAMIQDETGWTMAHHFLKKEGIDPTRIDEIRSFLKGETEASFEGQVPEYVPEEYREAFQSLSKINREDVMFNLNPESSDSPDARQGALQILRNQQYRLDGERAEQQRAEQARQAEEQEIWNEVTTEATTTYQAIFDSLEKGTTFTKAKISSNELLDTVAKNSFITQLNALGDPNTMLARRAAEFMEGHGVKIDYNQVNQLMTELDQAIQTKAVAGRKGHQQYVTHANSVIKQNTAKLTALGNKYFVEYVKHLTSSQKQSAEQFNNIIESNAGLPSLEGDTANTARKMEGSASKFLTDMARQVAAANRQQNQ